MDSLFLVFAAFAFAFGTILGSFLNALLFRYHTGEGMGGRSHCMRCGHTLGAGELIPIVSYLALRGRCRSCKSKISPQYPLIELLAGLLSLGIYLLNPMQLASWGLGVTLWMILLFVVVYDFEHKIVPMEALVILGVLGFGSLFLSCHETCQLVVPGWWVLLSGFLVGAPLLLISAISGGRWMGWGDGLLMTALGFVLGISGGYSAEIFGFWSGAIVGLTVMWTMSWRRAGKQLTMKSEIPFAPFLVCGAVLVYFFHFDLFSLIFA